MPIQAPMYSLKCKWAPMHPNLPTGYDQALGVIKDSINAANPLASLNL